MHEVAIIEELITTVNEECQKNKIDQVNVIKLGVGRLSGVVPHALEFGFSAIKNGPLLEHCNLIISEIKPVYCCNDCSFSFTTNELCYTCQNCESRNVRLVEGEDLILECIEGKGA